MTERTSTEATVTPTTAVSRRVRSSFWPMFWFAAVAIGCKAIICGVPDTMKWWLWARFGQQFAVSIHVDIFFALVGGLVLQIGLLLCRPWPRWERAAFVAVIIFGLFCTLWSVVHIYVHDLIRVPISYGLLDLLGGFDALPGLAMRLVSGKMALTLLAVGGGYLLLVLLCDRFNQPRRANWFRGLQLIAVIALVAYAGIVQGIVNPARGKPPKYYDPRIADSPQWVLFSSTWNELAHRRHLLVDGSFPPEFIDDFRIVAERPKAGAPTQGLARRPRNIILVVLESVATRYLGIYGSKYSSTPCLEAEKRNALVFDNIYAPFTNSGSSLVAIVLSTYTPMGWKEWIGEHPDMPGVTMSASLKERGYRTAFISSIDFDYGNGMKFLEGRGFDTRWDYRQSGRPKTSEWGWGVDDAWMIDTTLQWIRQQAGEDRSRPFFVMCWNQNTHWPFDPPPGENEIDFLRGESSEEDYDLWRSEASEGVSALNAYLNAVHRTDRQLGRLFQGLREMKLADDTLVVIVGDHGEGLGAHGSYGHSGLCYEGDIHVPCIIWNPAILQSKPRPATVGGLVDVAPTVFDLLGLPLPASWQGRSLISSTHSGRSYFYGSKGDYRLGVREGPMKYFSSTITGQDELYDLSSDPDEKVNLASSRPEMCRRFRQRLAAWLHYQIRLYSSSR